MERRDGIVALLQRGLEFHQADRLAEAEAAYSDVLARDPENCDALNLMGILVSAKALHAQAIAFFDRAIAANPRFADVHFNKGNALVAVGHTARAAASYRKAIELDSRKADAYLNLGGLLRGAAKHLEALEVFRALVRTCRDDPRGYYNLGYCLLDAKDHAAAAAALETAIRLAPDYSEAHIILADAYGGLGRYTEAAEQCGAALRGRSDWVDARERLGLMLRQAGKAVEAAEVFKELIADVADPERRAAAWCGLGDTHKDRGNFADAIASYESALSIKKSPEALNGVAELFAEQEWLAAAIVLVDEAAAAKPDDVRFVYNLGLLQLKQGQFEKGWRNYGARFKATRIAEGTTWQETKVPHCEDVNLSDRCVFAWQEQGLGDQILFAGVLPDLIARARKVYVDVPARLARVFARSFVDVVVMARAEGEESVTIPLEADCQTSVGDLGRLFRPGLASFPNRKGYLKADPDRMAALRARYESVAAGRRIVGVSWRSGALGLGPHKSTDLSDWADILKTPDTLFVSLQYGDCLADLARVKDTLGIDVFRDPAVDPIGDLDDFFAQVAAMDLVISTSNTTVHVAGSMNIPTWVMLPRGSGALWYWFMDREDSPWYPSVRLFRSEGSSHGTWWNDPMHRAGSELAAWRAQGVHRAERP